MKNECRVSKEIKGSSPADAKLDVEESAVWKDVRKAVVAICPVMNRHECHVELLD